MGYANGTLTVTSNENTAASVTLAASGSPVTVGGLIGFTHDKSNVTISSNKNRASVLLDTNSAYCPAGGVVYNFTYSCNFIISTFGKSIFLRMSK